MGPFHTHTQVMDLTTELLRAENITYSEVRFPSFAGVSSLENRLFVSCWYNGFNYLVNIMTKVSMRAPLWMVIVSIDNL